jgi:hypothetical protein
LFRNPTIKKQNNSQDLSSKIGGAAGAVTPLSYVKGSAPVYNL